MLYEVITPAFFPRVRPYYGYKERYLQSAVSKDLFIERLARMREKHDCRIIDFMVMNNHIHLLLQPADNSSLSVRSYNFV